MLSNPVVVPAYADLMIWAFALLAMWAEIHTELTLLRRMGRDSGALRPLVFINLMTWLAFLFGVDWFDLQGVRNGSMVVIIAALEATVVIVEAILIRETIGRTIGGVARQRIAFRKAFKVSLVGNLVSIVVSIALPFVIIGLLRSVFG